MVHYKGLITEEPGIKAKPIGNSLYHSNTKLNYPESQVS